MANGNGKGPKVHRPGDLHDGALLSRRFEQHVEQQRLNSDLTIQKIERLTASFDDLRDEVRSLTRGMRKLFAMQKPTKPKKG